MQLFLSFSIAILLLGSSVAADEICFSDVTDQSGLRLALAGIMGHGGAVADVDRDGDVDIFVGGFCDRPNKEYVPSKGPVPSALLLNNGDGTFTAARQPALKFFGRTSGAVFADLDNDGWLDLYVANNCKGRTRLDINPQRQAQLRYSNLFRNDEGKFVDLTEASGACPESLRTARNIGVLDFDKDGLLDLLVMEDKFIRNPRSVLFRNLGQFRFEDVNAKVGLPDGVFGLGCAIADINRDGFPDFFVAHSNRMFLSDGKGGYRESDKLNKTFAWQPVNSRDKEDWPCGAAFGDLNRNGRLDLVLSIHHERARNRIYLNEGLKNGIPQFRDVSAAAGLPVELSNKSPHVEIQDFDNDGWPDIYLSSAWLDKDGTITPLVFRNQGERNGVPQFKPIREVRSGEPLVYFPAGPSGDFNNDGRLDLFLINWFAGNHCRLLRNTSASRNWLEIQVVGRTFNRMGIGSRVKVFKAGELGNDESLLGFQEITTGYGYASGQPAIAHFGLDDESTVDLQIIFPNGQLLERGNVTSNQRLVIDQPN